MIESPGLAFIMHMQAIQTIGLSPSTVFSVYNDVIPNTSF